MSRYAIMRLQKHHSVAAVSTLSKHVHRERVTPNADPARKYLNEPLAGTSDWAADVRARLACAPAPRKNAVIAIEHVLSASHEFFVTDDPAEETARRNAWRDASMEWLDELYGKDNVVSAEMQRDETSVHIHAVAVPITAKGTLSAWAFIGGERSKLRELQDSYAAKVAPLGLERGVRGSIATHQRVQQWYSRMWEQEQSRLPPEQAPDEALEQGMVPLEEQGAAGSGLEEGGKQRMEIAPQAISPHQDLVQQLEDLAELGKQLRQQQIASSAVREDVLPRELPRGASIEEPTATVDAIETLARQVEGLSRKVEEQAGLITAYQRAGAAKPPRTPSDVAIDIAMRTQHLTFEEAIEYLHDDRNGRELGERESDVGQGNAPTTDVVEVWHARLPAAEAYADPERAMLCWRTDPGQYRKVAQVEARDPEHAWEITQSQQDSWTTRSEVKWSADQEIRSTSVGDVLVYNGKAWFIEAQRFTEIPEREPPAPGSEERTTSAFQPPAEAPERWAAVRKSLVERSIPQEIVDGLHSEGYLYADPQGNAVFLRENEQKEVVGADLCRTTRWPGTVVNVAAGTQRDASWFTCALPDRENRNEPYGRPTLVLASAEIEGLSAGALFRELNDGHRDDGPITVMVIENPQALPHQRIEEIVRAGGIVRVALTERSAREQVYAEVRQRYRGAEVTRNDVPETDGWNAVLRNLRNPQQADKDLRARWQRDHPRNAEQQQAR